jgi:hypothetical protein
MVRELFDEYSKSMVNATRMSGRGVIMSILLGASGRWYNGEVSMLHARLLVAWPWLCL